MKTHTLARHALVLAVVLLIDACGGGSIGTADIAEGGIGGTGISQGPITGFGSIFVNGVEYHTEDAEVVVEGSTVGTGDAAVLNHLAVGKVVTVEAGIPSGGQATATRVRFDDNVEGPLETVTLIDVRTKQLTVLGQTVIVDRDTPMRNTTWDTLAVGNQLEISGLVMPDGGIRATFIEKTLDVFLPGGSVEVKGVVSGLDTAARSFRIAAVTVNYAGGTDLSELDAPLADGLGVEVKGIFSGGVLQATKIESEHGLETSATTSWLEVEAYVSAVVSATEFVLNGQTVRIDADTRFVGGTAADIAVGVRLEAEGPFSGGVLAADEIGFRDDIELQAVVASVGTDGLTLDGIAGLTVTVGDRTEIDGAANSLAEIAAGRFVKVRGRWDAAHNTVLASRIEVESPSSIVEVRLRGVPSALSNPFVTLLGATIDTTGLSYRGADGGTLTAEAFFARASTTRPVRLEGRQNRDTHVLTWTGIRLLE
ncbi:MAG: DUF5666 domain-containing protein [Pseudomonadota bacterium]